MSKKTERKNKTNLVVSWPKTPFFILQDVFDLQPDSKEITLRVRLIKQIESGKAAEIGYKTGGQGRPRKVFAFTPVTQATLDLAKSQGVQLVEQSKLQKLVSVPVVSPALVAPRQPVTA